jgi:DNA-binding MarR family transcriptional regulator
MSHVFNAPQRKSRTSPARSELRKTSTTATKPSGLAKPDQLISWALWQTEIAVDLALDALFAPLNLTATLQGTLRVIVDTPGQSTADLARLAGVRPQSMAHNVTRLEELGMVTREPHPVHKKVLQVYPTDAGRKSLLAVSRILMAVESDLCSGMKPQERSAFLHQLAAIRERARKLAAG